MRQLTALGHLIQSRMSELGLSNLAVEQRMGVSDNTIGRLLRRDPARIPLGQLAGLATTLDISFPQLLTAAGYPLSSDVDPETQRLATLVATQPDLAAIIAQLVELDPRDRGAVPRLIAALRPDPPRERDAR